MKFNDLVYGDFEVTEPVILEIVNTPSFQRLKGIDQNGYRPLWVNPKANVNKYHSSRFAHSMGVYHLLYLYQASLEEQIAGLIHDVSHSVFSHCIDYVLDKESEKRQDYQDRFFDEYVKKTRIPNIIENHGFDPEYILNDKNFPLLEKDLPDLCADRIDYSFKTMVMFEEINLEEKNYFLNNLIIKKNNWIFKDFESAKRYGEMFLKINRKYFSSFSSAVLFRAVGDCLKYSLKKEYIFMNDLYTEDEIVIEKIKNFLNKDEKLQLLFNRMNNKAKVINDPKNYDSEVFCKSRIVDPLFLKENKIKKLSQEKKEWLDVIEKELKPKRYFLKFKD